MSSIPVDQSLHNFIPENLSVNAMHLHQLKSETCEFSLHFYWSFICILCNMYTSLYLHLHLYLNVREGVDCKCDTRHEVHQRSMIHDSWGCWENLKKVMGKKMKSYTDILCIYLCKNWTLVHQIENN